MDEGRIIDPRHDDIRKVLRVVGPSLALVGLAFVAVGMVSFFSAFGTFEPPRYFWCLFVGLPLLGVGLAISRAGYLGSFLRYVMGEMAPVGKDTFNYVARGTSPGVRDLTRAVGQGLAEGFREPVGEGAAVGYCPKCGAGQGPGARFCSQCGTSLEPAAGVGDA